MSIDGNLAKVTPIFNKDKTKPDIDPSRAEKATSALNKPNPRGYSQVGNVYYLDSLEAEDTTNEPRDERKEVNAIYNEFLGNINDAIKNDLEGTKRMDLANEYIGKLEEIHRRASEALKNTELLVADRKKMILEKLNLG